MMVDNILQDIKTNKVNRIDVNFKILDKSIDNVIGRAAHIQFLESDQLSKMFSYCFDHLFE